METFIYQAVHPYPSRLKNGEITRQEQIESDMTSAGKCMSQ